MKCNNTIIVFLSFFFHCSAMAASGTALVNDFIKRTGELIVELEDIQVDVNLMPIGGSDEQITSVVTGPGAFCCLAWDELAAATLSTFNESLGAMKTPVTEINYSKINDFYMEKYLPLTEDIMSYLFDKDLNNSPLCKSIETDTKHFEDNPLSASSEDSDAAMAYLSKLHGSVSRIRSFLRQMQGTI